MPLHSWLPAAMVAPTPVSALLHAVAVVKTGVFATLRVFLFVFGTESMRQLGADTLALGFASVTILLASLLALDQDNLKARLAFSTISQLSYIVLGGALLTTSGIVGGIAHITNHAVSKITLFFCAGSIYVSTHKTEVSQMSGLARKMPWTMAAFAIASLSLVGIPPIVRLHLEVVSRAGIGRARKPVAAGRAAGQLAAERGLSRSGRVQGVLRSAGSGPRSRSHSRGAVDGRPDGVQRRRQPAPGHVSRSGAEAGGNGEAVKPQDARSYASVGR